MTLHGKTVVFTGSLERLTRREAKYMVEALGGKVSGSIGTKTNYLVVAPGAGISKKADAERQGVTILDEEEFYNMIKETN